MPHMNGLSGPELPLDEDIFDVFLWPCLIVNKCSWEKKGDVTYSWRSKYDRRDDSRDQKQEKEEERKCCECQARATNSCWRVVNKKGVLMLSMLIGKMASRDFRFCAFVRPYERGAGELMAIITRTQYQLQR